ncbi:MAG: hypothetical protein CFE29_04320 [Bradyrhizobiaceae bacterium PARB1]|jgi:hypothetical protein|nr:MAG: hypothetical protein CFE29_04320 [Bradyrhizobiaceae bacterium PARB1]
MEKAKQQELIRLWNQLRKTRGPAAEEIRIRILEKFKEPAMQIPPVGRNGHVRGWPSTSSLR